MTSLTVTQGLKRLGGDLKDARRRRRIKVALMAERIGVTRATLSRMEKGLPSVSMGVYASALHFLAPEKFKEFTDIISREKDLLGQIIADRELPQRVRGSSRI